MNSTGPAPLCLVIDTNLWLDMLVFDDPSTRRLAALLDPQAVAPLASDAMRAELAEVVDRDRFGLAPEQRRLLLARFDALVTPAPAAPDCRLPCRDPNDRKFLDLAVSRRVDWLLSRDKALLAGRRTAWSRFGVRIGKVGDFYNWLDHPGTATARPADPRP
jgi:putative PIN family toxin of toxin-antitoxin system